MKALKELFKKVLGGYVKTISMILWALEALFFYPKLSTFYRELFSKNLSYPQFSGGGMLIFDVGANKGQSIKFFKSLNPLVKAHSIRQPLFVGQVEWMVC